MQNQRGKQNRRMKKCKEKTDYDRDEKYYNHEPQPVYDFTNIKLSCFGTSKYRLTTRLNTTSPTLWYWIRSR